MVQPKKYLEDALLAGTVFSIFSPLRYSPAEIVASQAWDLPHTGFIIFLMKNFDIKHDTDIVKESLKDLPEPRVNPALVVVSGLPGTGKSYFCRQLASRYPLAILESDALRKVLFPAPAYQEEESTRLFKAIYSLIDELLSRGISAALDATNLEEKNRERLYSIAEKAGARLIVVQVEAAPSLVKQRLEQRARSKERLDSSEAGWDVYEKMRPGEERIARRHFRVDTARDITPVLEKVLRELRK